MSAEECLNDHQLQQLLQPTADGTEGARCERHLELCDRCRSRLLQLAGPLPNLGQQRASPETASLALSRVMHALRQNPPSRVPSELTPLAARQAAPQTTPDSPAMPGQLGRYALSRLLGQGGMGMVYEAFDPRLERRVAIKIPHQALIATAEAQARFVREARALAAVKHHHIVTIHSVEEAEGIPYMVMEFVDGPVARTTPDGRTFGRP